MPEDVTLSRGAPETVLPDPDPDMVASLQAALAEPEGRRTAAVEAVAARWPRQLEPWATLAELPGPVIGQYAFARVGYHRGLDTLRGAGWRGTGAVRWRHPSNRAFLRSVEALRDRAETIGEVDEAERCALFLRQLDPNWPPPDGQLPSRSS